MDKKIHYFSTNGKAPKVSFRDALLKGLAPDNGLYMPDTIPSLSAAEIREYADVPYYQIAYNVLYKYLHAEIDADDLLRLVADAYTYAVPLEPVYERKYVMRLDAGPTASFKDFAARMMGRLMQYFLARENQKLLILAATSGDTGSAVANAFYRLDNIKVLILFPEKEVTEMQRRQMTTLKKNVQIIAIDGKFDDCQAMVKRSFMDEELRVLKLSSANSINIGRLLPQSVYYIYAFAKLYNKQPDDTIVFSVPCGNFGNLMGGLLARTMGLPVDKFIISTNENNEVPLYFETNVYKLIVPSKNCISSAMNVGHPSNMARIISLYGGWMNEKGEILIPPDMEKMKRDMCAVSISDDQTRQTIRQAYDTYKLFLEPHGAVAWAGLQWYLNGEEKHDHSEKLCVSLETAHPAKFPEEIQRILSVYPELPPALFGLMEKEESYDSLPVDYAVFKKYLLDRYA